MKINIYSFASSCAAEGWDEDEGAFLQSAAPSLCSIIQLYMLFYYTLKEPKLSFKVSHTRVENVDFFIIFFCWGRRKKNDCLTNRMSDDMRVLV